MGNGTTLTLQGLLPQSLSIASRSLVRIGAAACSADRDDGWFLWRRFDQNLVLLNIQPTGRGALGRRVPGGGGVVGVAAREPARPVVVEARARGGLERRQNFRGRGEERPA